jgi:L-ascorbate metabolism protein UlaG (beta-lactamase superfamily)
MLRSFGARAAGLRRERIQGSPRWIDGRFQNTVPVRSLMSPGKLLSTSGEFFFGGRDRRPRGVIPVESPLEPWARQAETGLRATWLGHSTVLLEIDGVRVLTDPVFAERASPMSWAGPRRFHRVPAAVAELPPLDAVLVSHDHYDHLDHASIVALRDRDVPFVTSLGVGAHLEAWGVAPERIVELDWWEEARVAGGRLTFTAAPARHFSGRGPGTGNRTLWSSWSLRGERHAVFFSGDTGITEEFAEVGARLGPFDLVMLEVGAYHPSWGSIHLGPDNALIVHQMVRGRSFLPVHWGTFDLGLHAWDDPIERLAEGAGTRGLHLLTPRLGRPFEPARVEAIDPWWRALAVRGGAQELPPPADEPPAADGPDAQAPVETTA